jgi:uncharacterized protein YceK
MRHVVVVLTVALALAGCGSTRLDASSDESMKASLDKMSAGMTPAQKEALAKDVGIVMLRDGTKQAFQTAFSKDGAPAGKAELFKSLQGKTAGEIHERAEAIRREFAQEEKAK